jgi:hypothetical protein
MDLIEEIERLRNRANEIDDMHRTCSYDGVAPSAQCPILKEPHQCEPDTERCPIYDVPHPDLLREHAGHLQDEFDQACEPSADADEE